MNITDIQIRKIYPEPADIYLNGEYFVGLTDQLKLF
jgi:hypothetical protein